MKRVRFISWRCKRKKEACFSLIKSFVMITFQRVKYDTAIIAVKGAFWQLNNYFFLSLHQPSALLEQSNPSKSKKWRWFMSHFFSFNPQSLCTHLQVLSIFYSSLLHQPSQREAVIWEGKSWLEVKGRERRQVEWKTWKAGKKMGCNMYNNKCCKDEDRIPKWGTNMRLQRKGKWIGKKGWDTRW